MGHCGGQADDTILSSLLSDFLALGCSTSGGSTDVDDGDGDAASVAGASSEVAMPDALAMTLKATKVAERITSLLDKGMAGDVFQVQLARHVEKAIGEVSSSLQIQSSGPAFRLAVVSQLREAGYNAAVCQTRWRGTRDMSAGSYEYIDVVTAVTAAAGKADADGERYIVDVRFATEFMVARPSGAYAHVLGALPRVLVAQPVVVRQVVRLASKAARRSLKSQGLTVPPWRKKRFVAAKWLGPYRRAPGAPIVAAGDAMCRTVGFLLGPQVQPWLSWGLE
ncbi:unnamed protein product [Urochloa decumbens]|uniref:Plant-specific domain TIGR01615 family protein n=1 Tax=Urochloa decumbens TaxID=240449 RepID=A0ABC9AMG7_9POAL